MQNQRFFKYHGLGNDFVVIDRRAGGEALSAEVVRALCHRRLGIGADGVLTVWPASGQCEDGAPLVGRMQVQNADGSEAGMCGNGLRAVARFLCDEGGVSTPDGVFAIKVGMAAYRCARVSPTRFRVRMGKADANATHLPPPTRGRTELALAAKGRSFVGTRLSLGNPHLVIFSDDEAPLALAERYGQGLERHPVFPDRVNVSFAKPVPGGFEAVVYERGVGITQACGSGACAIGAAATERGLWPAARPMEVRLLGGTLAITVEVDGTIWMEGEAMRVFIGEVSL